MRGREGEGGGGLKEEKTGSNISFFAFVVRKSFNKRKIVVSTY